MGPDGPCCIKFKPNTVRWAEQEASMHGSRQTFPLSFCTRCGERKRRARGKGRRRLDPCRNACIFRVVVGGGIQIDPACSNTPAEVMDAEARKATHGQSESRTRRRSRVEAHVPIVRIPEGALEKVAYANDLFPAAEGAAGKDAETQGD